MTRCTPRLTKFWWSFRARVTSLRWRRIGLRKHFRFRSIHTAIGNSKWWAITRAATVLRVMWPRGMDKRAGVRATSPFLPGTVPFLRNLAALLVAAFEGQLGNAGLVQFAQAFFLHAVELFLGGRGEWRVDLLLFREVERNAGIFRRVCRGEEAGVLAVLHVFAVGREHTGIGAGLGKNFAQHGEVKPQRVAQRESLGESSSVDVHHHVHEGLHLRGLTGSADVAQEPAAVAELFEERFQFVEGRLLAAAH